MGCLVAAAVVLLALAVFAVVLVKRFGLIKTPARMSSPPFRRKDFLLTRAERSFYEVVCTVLGGDLTVFVKVRLLDLLWLPQGTENPRSYRNQVQSKHVDFVLCDRAALKPVLVIELDDASHDKESRRSRDSFVDAVLAGAGLPVLRVRAAQGYVPADLRRRIDEALAGSSVKP